MESINSALKIKLAWQEAYRLRSCPGDDMLFAEQPTIETERHLKICPACSDTRNAAPQVSTAWRELGDRLSDGVSAHKATDVPPVEGQVWALSDDLSHWSGDGNFYRPPRVLLLGIEGIALKVAQTYHDTALADDGDVLLTGNRFGFAQSWNIYTIHREMLDYCIGGVKQEELLDVLREAGKQRAYIDENSILYWFRITEIMVGAEIAMPAVAQLMEEMEAAVSQVTVEGWLINILGSFSDVFRKLEQKCDLPSLDSLPDLLWLARSGDMAQVLSMASSETSLQVNVVRKNAEDDIVIKTISTTITDNSWEDGTYFVAGKLDYEFSSGIHLLSWLSDGDEKIGDYVKEIPENNLPYFDISFHDVPEKTSKLENLKIILVSP